MELEVNVTDRYSEVKTVVLIVLKLFEVRVTVHQGSALSPLLFVIVMAVPTDILNFKG